MDGVEHDDTLDDPQLPPRGPMATTAWIEAGHYLAWHCEPVRHPSRPGSPHSANRICTNDALSTAPDGPFPVGAASIKELYNVDKLVGFALMRKVEPDSRGGAGWYWYEAIGDDVVVASHGAGNCVGCHGDAPRDFAYTVVP